MNWSLTYADGAANTYAITPTSFVYTPVTPAQSSTGTYSGGPPRSGYISPELADQVFAAVEALAADTANHIADRIKGSGAFAMTTDAGMRRFLVNRGPALLAFDALLATLA